MLKLKRVELQGFKSFCDRSEMRFHGTGVAAIVGPNGCGKSNLSDAISWVLGEQSARSLRGTRMEDVIFAGTRERKPVGMASVTLTLIDPSVHATDFPAVANGNGNGNGNGHGNIHIDAAREVKNGEITVTRRLYRSGESEYLINGRTARLRDIQDLFMGTGLGPESYAIIEQGRIGQILSTKPADRRAVIEEAAGITRFRTKKRLAEAKLESAKANLTRVFDILEEVTRQLNSLKRQAAKARRYEELRTELLAQLRLALSGRAKVLTAAIASTSAELESATGELSALTAAVAEQEKASTALLEASYALEAALSEARKELTDRRVEAERVRGRLEAQAREVASIEQRLARGEADSQEIEQRIEAARGEATGFTERITELNAQVEVTGKELGAKTADRDRAQSALRARESEIESTRQQVLKLLGETSTLRNQLAQVDQFLLGLNRDTERLTRDESTAASEIERVTAAAAEVTDRKRERETELQSITDARKTAEAELALGRTRAAETRRQLEEVRADVSRLKARRDSLGEILLHRTYTTGTVKRLFSAVDKGQTGGWKPLGVLADFLESDGTYERAAEEFLHDELEYVAVGTWEEAERGLQWMRGGGEGHATFLVMPSGSEGETAPAPVLDDPGIKARLADVIRFTGNLAGASPLLVPRIARCFLVEGTGDAQRLAVQYPDYYFLLPDGVCFHGQTISGGKKSGAGPLGLKRELREVTTKWQARQKDFDETRAALEASEGEIARFTEELEVLRGRQNLREKEVLALDHESRKLNEELNRSRSRLNVARNELTRLSAEQERSAARREQLRVAAEEKENARLAQEQSLTSARAELDQLSREAARLAEEHSAVRVALAGLEERRKSDTAAQGRLQTQIRDLENRRNQVNSDMARLGAERSRLLADNIELDNRSGVLTTEMAALETQVARIAAEETETRAQLAAADESLKVVRQEAANVSERRTAFEIELVKKQAELKYLEETCRKDLACELAEVPAPENELDDAALAEAEAQSAALRSKIDALGPVNTQAVEEFEEAQQRYDFLSAQRQDLLDSIRDTERAIAEIDAESRKRFAHAFEAINEHFREMFSTLFNGGVGEMRLTDAENAMESGIDIVASPPGKKLQSVLLLSGGERALTAMALLMAIFRFQPSPFCVLDEVDAPLDDANTERLVRLVKEMAAHTQFVVITHSKRTMEAAQALYGVTMQEPGVSKLVSVRFAPVPPPPVPAVQPQLAM